MIRRETTRRPLAAWLVLGGLLTLQPQPSQAESWPSWRGPRGNGVSGETDVPLRWSRSENVAWRVDMPGAAGATPAVWGERVFVSSQDGDELVLLCLNTDGALLWRRPIGSGSDRYRGDEGNNASPSPMTDGQHVWVSMSNGAIACLDMEGDVVWSGNLQDKFGRFKIQFGMASTPVLHEGRLYLQLIHGDGKAETHEAVVAALDAATGKELWRAPRVTQAHTENEHSYASPILYRDEERQYLVTHGADYAVAYDLDSGRELWRLGGLNPHDDPQRRYHPTLRFVASPGFAPGIIVVPTAKNGPVVAIRPDGRGVLGESSILWERADNTPDVPSPLVHDGLVYLGRENGNLLCLEAETGVEVYQERTVRDRHRASPVYADGHVYLTARNGTVTVVKAGREFEIAAQNELGEEMSASPAIANGTIYLRTFSALWAIRD